MPTQTVPSGKHFRCLSTRDVVRWQILTRFGPVAAELDLSHVDELTTPQLEVTGPCVIPLQWAMVIAPWSYAERIAISMKPSLPAPGSNAPSASNDSREPQEEPTQVSP